jgi:hypothetical protein
MCSGRLTWQTDGQIHPLLLTENHTVFANEARGLAEEIRSSVASKIILLSSFGKSVLAT